MDHTQNAEVADWWRTSICEVKPNSIRMRGYAIEELIGRIGFIDMLWLLVRGDLPTAEQARLLEAAMLGGVDHGPHAPSIAIARMAITCGVSMNTAVAEGVGVLGDIHGGAIEQSMELLRGLVDDAVATDDPAALGREVLERSKVYGGFVPGYGHRFHQRDPRSPRVLELAEEAVRRGDIDGKYVRMAQQVEAAIAAAKGKPIPMNVDAAAGAVYLELGFDPPMGRALLVLSRSLGIVAHAWEQSTRKERIKGPVPKSSRYTYEGPAPRTLSEPT
ncbi:citryl-CoA lyase [Microvirga antarctica]|uniref:citryl-CoA lyase n=1 Tax=Microvirga antarctica TaxID=2819233 RepID=UPI001B302B35|nr:citryl-CoA lyase [Microvirga antarctica]